MRQRRRRTPTNRLRDVAKKKAHHRAAPGQWSSTYSTVAEKSWSVSKFLVCALGVRYRPQAPSVSWALGYRSGVLPVGYSGGCHDELMKQTERALPQRMISMSW